MRAARRGVGMAVGVALALGAQALPRAHAGLAPNDYFKLDLPHAVLLPEPLGPPAHFAPSGTAGTDATPWLPAPAQAAAAPLPAAPGSDRAPPARSRLARHRASPLDARAAMAKPRARSPITRWPCRSGAICAWQNPPPQH
jgi:hypothetical protein